MPIITKAGSPVKGSPTEFTLDKAELLLLVSDPYFLDADNWKSVQLNYRSSTSKQAIAVKFDATVTPCVGNFATSLKANNEFLIHNIVIKDFDGGTFAIYRSDLTTADFDVDMTPAPLSGFTWGQIGGGIFNNTATQVQLVSGGSGGYNSGAYSNEILSLTSAGSVTFKYDFSGDVSTPYGPIGFSDSTGGGASPIDYGIFATGSAIQLALNNTWPATPTISPLTSPATYGVTEFTVAIEGSNFVLYQDGIKRDERLISSVASATGPQRFWMNFAGQTGQTVTIINKTGSWI